MIEGAANGLQIRLMRGGNRIEIEELDVVATGIVIAADEPRIRGNVDASLPQAIAYFRPVGHGGKKPCVRPAATPSAGATIVSRLVRVVEAGRSVAQNHHQAGEIAHQAGRTQDAGDSFCLFFRSESHQQTRKLRLGIAWCSASA